MKDRAWVEDQLARIRERKKRLLADLHAHDGAEQFALLWLQDDPPTGTTDLSALTDAIQAGSDIKA